ncbi:hypothetical protein M2149_000803 [Lachnospiraceae bacterium PFB1-21]
MDKTITIKATMNERWIDDFCSFLNYMEKCGNVGHTGIVSFLADGDGDFRPKFEIDTKYNKTDGRTEGLLKPEVMFDAG